MKEWSQELKNAQQFHNIQSYTDESIQLSYTSLSKSNLKTFNNGK